ncbi:hypothetical protein BS412_21140 [Cronobacter turicensis]|uniref:Uncharacterized protein n=1 Tax=Cronobacter turicensis TaxID=413502 RepID=A0A2T7B8M5_9ENTR|nr:hypothetical protein BS411_04610 [Cronobacter turicensis]PUX29078.1 hypothetical protein BS412_21140 [Cronobacter turicensis]
MISRSASHGALIISFFPSAAPIRCFTYNPRAIMKLSYNRVFPPSALRQLCYNRASFDGWALFLYGFRI